MAEKLEKCPECDYSTNTTKGINIHRRKIHHRTLLANGNHSPELPSDFIRSLSTTQLRLLGPWPGRCHPAASMRPGGYLRTPTPFAMPRDIPNFAASLHSPLGSHPPFSPEIGTPCLMQRNDRMPLRQYTERTQVSETREENSADTTARLPGSHVCPTNTGPPAHTESNPRRPQASAAPPTGSIESELSSMDTESEPAPRSYQENSSDCRGSVTNSCTATNTQKTPTTEGDSDQSSPGVLPPSNKNMSPKRRRSPPGLFEETDDLDSDLWCSSVGDFCSFHNPGRRPLKYFWPASLSNLVASGQLKAGLQQLGRESETAGDARRDLIFLKLLGDCLVLDYDSSCAWDIVLRCTLCGMPTTGVNNMESHIMGHLGEPPSRTPYRGYVVDSIRSPVGRLPARDLRSHPTSPLAELPPQMARNDLTPE